MNVKTITDPCGRSTYIEVAMSEMDTAMVVDPKRLVDDVRYMVAKEVANIIIDRLKPVLEKALSGEEPK